MPMKDYKKQYYEQSCHWERNYIQNPAEEERIKEIIGAIPSDAHSLLDVGCGNGAFVNTIVRSFSNKFVRIIGLDTSEKALEFVKSEKTHATITSLPFANDSFDLVTCLEVLEHLTYQEFRKGILELQRVSKKYIIITVPNDQHLTSSLIMCPECHCWFNPSFHMRTFNEHSLHNLFNNFTLLKMKGIGPLLRECHSNNHLLLFLLILYRISSRALPPETPICPQCGYRYKKKLNTIVNSKTKPVYLLRDTLFSFKPLVKMIWPKTKKSLWLLALYEKTHI